MKSIVKLSFFIISCLILLLVLFGSVMNAAPNTNPTWYVDARVINHGQANPYDYYAAKDPTIVYYGGKYHVFYTGANRSGGWQMLYTSASTIAGLQNAPRTYMNKIGESYFCAPEVFYFEPQGLWYLVYQDGTYGAAYATTTNIGDPNSWSGPKSFGVSGNMGWDYYIICDDTYAYMYNTPSDGSGKLYMRKTTLANFPKGWSAPTVAISNTFEASEVYKSLADGKYYLLVEDMKDGRYYELWTSSSAGGPWTQVAEKWAWRGNLSYNADKWTTNVSHGELIRAGVNQKLEINDINRVDFLIQGTTNTSGDYQKINWDLGVIHNYIRTSGSIPTPVLTNTLTMPVTATLSSIKIMPCGDSVTAGIGSTGSGSYRTDLYNYYKNAGISFDFVGSQSGGPGTLPDKNHEGHSGWTIPQVAGSVNGWLNTYNPDVMLLMIGGNDTLQGTVPTSRLSSLIDQITNLKPNLILFVADYYDSLPSNPNYNLIKQYNAAIPGMVQSKANAGKHVYFVKLSDANFASSEYADGLHPTDSGYSKLATIWYKSTITILKSLIGPTTPTPGPTSSLTPTPTPTSTLSPTSVPTATPQPAGALKVQFNNGGKADPSNQLYMNFQLINTGSSAVTLSNVKIRYWYTEDGTQAQSFWCDYAPVGSSNVTGTFGKMGTAKTNADTYLEIGFTSGAGNLNPGASTQVQCRCAKSDWSSYTQSNDYSFNSTASAYVDWAKVTGYVSGALQWGVEP